MVTCFLTTRHFAHAITVAKSGIHLPTPQLGIMEFPYRLTIAETIAVEK